MTVKQLVLKKVYPVLMKLAKNKAVVMVNPTNQPALQSFYSLKTELNNGDLLPFESLRNKKVMIVNTASDCGYTAQYEALQQLWEQYSSSLTIIAFPTNDFGEQEKKSDDAIASFCKINYGVTFPIAKKSVVLKSPDQNPVFQWLTDRSFNGWNDQPPQWNFTKYLINEKGILTHYFDSAVSPLSKEVVTAVRK